MGRIKTTQVKRLTKQLEKRYGDSASEDFGKSKLFVSKHLSHSSKKIRNVIAGYSVRLAKRKD